MIDLVTAACLTGFLGDAVLQTLVYNGWGGKDGWGLKAYFARHGRAEAMCIAAGMMTLFYIIYLQLNLPINIYNLAAYGIVLDLIFRKCRLFPSLDGYYKHLNYFWSAVWGAIPMILPLLLVRFANRVSQGFLI